LETLSKPGKKSGSQFELKPIYSFLISALPLNSKFACPETEVEDFEIQVDDSMIDKYVRIPQPLRNTVKPEENKTFPAITGNS